MGYGVNGARVDAVWVLRTSPRRCMEVSEGLKALTHSTNSTPGKSSSLLAAELNTTTTESTSRSCRCRDINTLCVGRAQFIQMSSLGLLSANVGNAPASEYVMHRTGTQNANRKAFTLRHYDYQCYQGFLILRLRFLPISLIDAISRRKLTSSNSI